MEKKIGSGMLKWAVPAVVLGAALAYSAWAGAFMGAARAEADPVPVRTVKPETGTLSRNLVLKGHIESDSMVTVLPFVSGILKRAEARVGDRVRKDQTMAEIDSERYRLQLKQAEAAWLSSQSAWDRISQLYAAGAATQQSMEQAKTQYEAYGSQYELAKMQLGYATVKSPVSGVVLVKHLSEGDIASPERPLYTIGDLDSLVSKVQVPESWYGRFSRDPAGIGVTVTHLSGGAYRAKVRSVSPYVQADSKKFEVVVAVADGDGSLRPGMFVTVTFELERREGAVSLPFGALDRSGRLWTISGGVATSEAFKPDWSNDDRFQVPASFAGRDFVVEGLTFLKDGTKVKAVPGAAE